MANKLQPHLFLFLSFVAAVGWSAKLASKAGPAFPCGLWSVCQLTLIRLICQINVKKAAWSGGFTTCIYMYSMYFFHIHIKTKSSPLKHQLNCLNFDQILTKSFPCMIHNLLSFKVFFCFFTHPDQNYFSHYNYSKTLCSNLNRMASKKLK